MLLACVFVCRFAAPNGLTSPKFVFGRFGGAALRAISEASSSPSCHRAIGYALAKPLRDWCQFLVTAGPRCIVHSHPEPPIVFNDGADEFGSDGSPQVLAASSLIQEAAH